MKIENWDLIFENSKNVNKREIAKMKSFWWGSRERKRVKNVWGIDLIKHFLFYKRMLWWIPVIFISIIDRMVIYKKYIRKGVCIICYIIRLQKLLLSKKHKENLKILNCRHIWHFGTSPAIFIFLEMEAVWAQVLRKMGDGSKGKWAETHFRLGN